MQLRFYQWASIALLFYGVLILIVEFWLDTPGGAALPFTICPFFNATGVPCPGCGLSRGVAAVVRGDFDHALLYHHGSIGAFLVALLFAATRISRRIEALYWRYEQVIERSIYFLAALVLLYGALRVVTLLYYPDIASKLFYDFPETPYIRKALIWIFHYLIH